jgi:hypothetical protein
MIFFQENPFLLQTTFLVSLAQSKQALVCLLSELWTLIWIMDTCVFMADPAIKLNCFIWIIDTHFIGSSNHGHALYFFIWILDRHSSEWSTLVSSELWMPAPFFSSVMKPLARWKWVCGNELKPRGANVDGRQGLKVNSCSLIAIVKSISLHHYGEIDCYLKLVGLPVENSRQVWIFAPLGGAIVRQK